LCREVENLLDFFETAKSFVKKPAAAEVASLITLSTVDYKSQKIVLLQRAK